jgi:DNA topoisomerase-1
MLLYNYFLLQYGGKSKWTILHHNGPLFPPLYKPHNIPVIINSNKYMLSEQAEEYATMYAKYLNTDYINNNRFKKNFWKDFKKVLSFQDDFTETVNSIDDIDFSLIHNYLEEIKKNKISISQNEKEEIEEKYKYCIIDGVKQNVGNYKIEPPGIFLGRGNHPKTGHIKKRIFPSDIILNLSKDAHTPIPSIGENYKWKKIIHDRNVIWLASWKENVTGKTKYIFTSHDSFFKSKSDESKFDLARKLKKNVIQIRDIYTKELLNDDMKIRQLATALYFIDNLALRVGNNKDTKEEADTVGTTSLRVEHITLLENNIIKLDFLGKDSIRFCKKIDVSEDVYNNIKLFSYNKNKKDLLFDLINPTLLNNYLNDFMPNLTSKVWRTYNASYLFQKEIDKIKLDKKIEPEERINYLLSMFNHANTQVALLCNHQKGSIVKLNNSINKYDDQIKKFNKSMINKTPDKIKKIKTKIKILKIKKKMKSKNVSLGTSKTNYIDPRIIFSFLKKFEIDPSKFFTKSLLKRFEWASNVDENYKF